MLISGGSRTPMLALNLRAAIVALAMMLVLAVVATPAARAQTFKVIYTFEAGTGNTPYAGLTMDKAGNLYGTTNLGGINGCAYNLGCGTVLKLSNKGAGWVLTPLYDF